jgi:HAD superfamily hydrolase (TIGR01509 family)
MAKGCVIFDFDGVIADTESLHVAAYNHALAAHAADIGGPGPLQISPPSYFSRYIVYGDREGFQHMLHDNGRRTDAALLDTLTAAKEQFFLKSLSDFADPLPGVRETLAWLEERHIPRAICSGARRSEIDLLLAAFKLRHHFDVIVSIEDVRFGKPEPEGYNKAFDLLNLEYDAELDKARSLVIEDSAGGCSAGLAAGLRVLGVATSLPLEQVQRHATFAVENLSKVDRGVLAEWLGVGV